MPQEASQGLYVIPLISNLPNWLLIDCLCTCYTKNSLALAWRQVACWPCYLNFRYISIKYNYLIQEGVLAQAAVPGKPWLRHHCENERHHTEGERFRSCIFIMQHMNQEIQQNLFKCYAQLQHGTRKNTTLWFCVSSNPKWNGSSFQQKSTC